MSVEFRIQFTIITEDDAEGFVGVDGAQFKVCTKGMLQETSIVGRHLQPIGTSDFQESLVPRFSIDGMRQFT